MVPNQRKKFGLKPKPKILSVKSWIRDIQRKQNILNLYEEIGTEVFGNSRVVEILGCPEVTTTSYLKKMEKDLKVIVPVEGMGKGKYRFLIGDIYI